MKMRFLVASIEKQPLALAKEFDYNNLIIKNFIRQMLKRKIPQDILELIKFTFNTTN
jgi:hypothetical protein